MWPLAPPQPCDRVLAESAGSSRSVSLESHNYEKATFRWSCSRSESLQRPTGFPSKANQEHRR